MAEDKKVTKAKVKAKPKVGQTIIQRLAIIQKELKAPKGQLNKFGGYKYRSAEDILEAVKPLLNGLILTLSDELVVKGQRYYIRAKATLKSDSSEYSTIAYAREAELKKGMDEAQITGSASSYARKYALNGLLAIADNDDPDATNDGKDEKVVKPKVTAPKADTADELDLG